MRGQTLRGIPRRTQLKRLSIAQARSADPALVASCAVTEDSGHRASHLSLTAHGMKEFTASKAMTRRFRALQVVTPSFYTLRTSSRTRAQIKEQAHPTHGPDHRRNGLRLSLR